MKDGVSVGYDAAFDKVGRVVAKSLTMAEEMGGKSASRHTSQAICRGNEIDRLEALPVVVDYTIDDLAELPIYHLVLRLLLEIISAATLHALWRSRHVNVQSATRRHDL